MGNQVTDRLADTTSSASSSPQSGQEVGNSGAGTLGSAATIAVGDSGPVLGHSGLSSTSSGGTVLLAPSVAGLMVSGQGPVGQLSTVLDGSASLAAPSTSIVSMAYTICGHELRGPSRREPDCCSLRHALAFE